MSLDIENDEAYSPKRWHVCKYDKSKIPSPNNESGTSGTGTKYYLLVVYDEVVSLPGRIMVTKLIKADKRKLKNSRNCIKFSLGSTKVYACLDTIQTIVYTDTDGNIPDGSSHLHQRA